MEKLNYSRLTVHKGENRIKIPKQQSRIERQTSACRNCPWWKDPFNRRYVDARVQNRWGGKARIFMFTPWTPGSGLQTFPPTFTSLSSSVPSNCPALISRAAFEDRFQSSVFLALVFYFVLNTSFLPILPRHLPQGPQILSFSIYLQMRLGRCYLFLYSVLHFLSRLMSAANPFLRFKLVKTKKKWKGHVSKDSSVIVYEQLEQVISSAFSLYLYLTALLDKPSATTLLPDVRK